MSEWWTKPTRKAVESHIKPVLDAAEIFTRWPGYALPKEVPTEYVRFSWHPGRPRDVGMGRTRRQEAACFAKFGIFTRLNDASQDRNDTIAGIVALAFPKNLVLERDGVRLDLETIDHTQFVERDGWGYSPVDVNWTCWRTT